MVLQVLLINRLQLGGVCHPFIYILPLLTMPITLPRWADMLIGLAAGLLMDVFCNSLGVHAAHAADNASDEDMENAIQAGRDGKVTSIAVAPGDSVLEGTVLLTIE